jgi:hypothetical protein
MVGRRSAAVALCAGLLAFTERVRAQTAGRLTAILDRFRWQSTTEQYKQVNEAIDASPNLSRELTAAADADRLKGIRAAGPQQSPKGPFQATVEDGWIVFAADFLAKVVPLRLQHAVRPGEIVPDNLVFVLGAFAFHLLNPPGPRPATMEGFIKGAVERDAKAFLNGWNDVVDWATRANRDRPLSVEQSSSLLLNLRYRTVFIGNEATFRKLAWSPGGRLEPTAGNIAAVAEGLPKMTLLDFGVPPQFQR